MRSREFEISATDVKDDGARSVLWSRIGNPCIRLFLGLSPSAKTPRVDDTFSVGDNVAVLAQIVGDAVVALVGKRGAGREGVSTTRGVEEQDWKEREDSHWQCLSMDNSGQTK